MKVDVERSGLEHLSLMMEARSEVEWVARVLAEAGKEVKPNPVGDIRTFIVSGYRRGTTRYYVSMRVHQRRAGRLTLTMNYLGNRDISQSGMAVMEKVLSNLEVDCEVDASAHCDVDTERTAVSIPILAFNAPGSAFDEIRGVRLVKETDKGTESTVLDIDDDGIPYAIFRVTYREKLSAKTPARALGLLRRLRNKMVLPAEEDE